MRHPQRTQGTSGGKAPGTKIKLSMCIHLLLRLQTGLDGTSVLTHQNKYLKTTRNLVPYM